MIPRSGRRLETYVVSRGVQGATTLDGGADAGGEGGNGAVGAHADGSHPQGGATRKTRRRRGAGRVQATPKRVLWRWCNQNMPAAWDLDLDLADGDGDGGGDGATPLVREGLAVVRDSGEWWRQLVRLLVERLCACVSPHGVHAYMYTWSWHCPVVGQRPLPPRACLCTALGCKRSAYSERLRLVEACQRWLS